MSKSVLGLAATALLFSATSTTVFANSSIEQIKKRAAEINELKSLVQSADPALRLAAIDTMQNSEDLAMREMAFSAGVNASDESVVALTIRNKFSELDTFVVSLVKPVEGEEALKVYNDIGGRVLFNIREYNKDKGTFVNDTHMKGNDYNSTISGLNLFLDSYYCQGEFKLDEDLAYRGNITCKKQQFPATINLF